jgi:adenylate cyclase
MSAAAQGSDTRLPRQIAADRPTLVDPALRADEPAAIIERLVTQAEMAAERLLAQARMATSAILLLALLVSAALAEGISELEQQGIVIATAMICAFFMLGVVALILARPRLWRPWHAYAFVGADVTLMIAGLHYGLKVTHLSGAFAFTIPVTSAMPVLLAVGSLRFRPRVQVFATVLMAAGIAIAVATAGLASGAGAAFVVPDGLFAVPQNILRLVMLILVGAVLAFSMARSRALLIRSVRETTQRQTLRRFLPAEIADVMETDRFGELQRGRRLKAAIVFVDIRNSTALAETMDPARLSVLISSFRRRVTAAAQAHQGVIDKFIGDGALVIFGAPEPRADDAARALAFGRDLARRISRWDEKRGREEPVRIGIGAHVGEIFCGLIGDEERLEFTVLGDTVNIAARIEELTKEVGVPVLASREAVAEAGELELWREIKRDTLRGRSEPVAVMELADLAR